MVTPRVLIVSTDVVGAAMAGPGIRAWEIARALAGEFAVTLATPGVSERVPVGFRLVAYALGQPGALAAALAAADVVVGQGFVFEQHPELLESSLPLAVDLYDPLLLEALDLYARLPADEAIERHRRYVALTNALLRRGDFFFCATEVQRDYWLGALSALGRVNALTYAQDQRLLALIDRLPSGIAATPPIAARPMLRGVHPAIGADDRLLLWAGGLWDWFDPLVVIRAVAALQDERPPVRLCFFAGARPNPMGAPFRTTNHERAHALAAELGVLDQSVIFLDEWVAYDQRGGYLAEADAGISAHLPGVETRFAFRTRLLDYLWARLPVVCSAGDSLGEEIAREGAGLLVGTQDLDGWIAALRRIRDDAALRERCRGAAERLAAQYAWSNVVRPLGAFCRAARPAPDRGMRLEPPAPEELKDERRHSTRERHNRMSDIPATADQELASLVAALPWYHTIDLGNGLVTPGLYDHRPYLQKYGIPHDLSGKRVLDIGAASGFFSFELERRGAQVTATDLPEWFDHDFGPTYQPDQTADSGRRYLHEPLDVAKRALGSAVVKQNINIYDISPATVGTFDLVFCGSLLIHLTDPIKAIWNIASVTTDQAIIATVATPDQPDRSLAHMVGYASGDSWWVPTRACLELMAVAAGFVGVEWVSEFHLNYRDGSPGPYHGVLRAYKTTAGWTPQTIHRDTLIERQRQPVRVPDVAPRPAVPDVAPLLRQLGEQQQQLRQLRALVEGYERGRFIRLMRWLRERRRS